MYSPLEQDYFTVGSWSNERKFHDIELAKAYADEAAKLKPGTTIYVLAHYSPVSAYTALVQPGPR